MNKFSPAATAAALLTLSGANAVADTLSLELTDDAFINANQPASNTDWGGNVAY